MPAVCVSLFLGSILFLPVCGSAFKLTAQCFDYCNFIVILISHSLNLPVLSFKFVLAHCIFI